MNLQLHIEASTPKYQQIINAVQDGIAGQSLQQGDQLPSVNELCRHYNLSRDTVFKAYSQLKDDGVIHAVANKGYYISGDSGKVFVMLDTFKAYKEVLYGALRKHLNSKVLIDLHFHHYNIQDFRSILNNAKGRYTRYIIMPFRHSEMTELLRQVNPKNALIIDWNIHSQSENNVVYQDFGTTVYHNLCEIEHLFRKYRHLNMVYPEFTYHPKEVIDEFRRFCKEKNFPNSVLLKSDKLKLQKGQAYFTVSDRMLSKILIQSKMNDYKLGQDIGILSYNETPMKPFIANGITVISTDFEAMGKAAAEFVTSNESFRICVPTKVIIRSSL